MASSAALKHLLLPPNSRHYFPLPPSSKPLALSRRRSSPENPITSSRHLRQLLSPVNSSPATSGNSPAEDGDGVSLGTMKLPPDTDIPRFESLLFQWANSLCQGANLPLPLPLKVDKIQGGVRLGFVTIGGDDVTEVLVYIDCLVFPEGEGSGGPLFRAVRNGAKKGQAPPGEPRIMKSLQAALQESVRIARL